MNPPQKTTTLTTLPRDIILLIAQQNFGTCLLRRHIVFQLQQMHVMTIRNNDLPGDYISSAHDLQIRTAAAQQMPKREKEYYAAKRRISYSLVNKEWRHCFLLAERDWLLMPPMDYRTFKHFCENPDEKQYSGHDVLVLELFPQQDFIDPPVELTVLTPADRQTLSDRSLANIGRLLILDEALFRDLCKLWISILPNLPPQVRRVRIIMKSPDAINMFRGPNHVAKSTLRDVVQQIRGIPSRYVRVGELFIETILD